MRTIEIPIYRFAELDPKNQELAIKDFKESYGYPHFSAASKSFFSLIRYFGGNDTTVLAWSRYLTSLDFENPNPNCPVPASVIYIFPDEQAINLIYAAFENWYKECCKDMAHFYSPNVFAEFCEENNYEFYGDGKLFTI